MPMPPGKIAWPPPDLVPVYADQVTWEAWWAGDADGLRKAYQPQGRVRQSQYAGGVVGAVSRFFWGRPQADLTVPQRQLHVPLASDLCQASADLLYADPIRPTIEGNVQAEERLDELLDDGLYGALAEAAELSAALGTSYLRVTWDQAVRREPFLTAVSGDQVVPVWRWGNLVEATVWRVVREDGQVVVRHLEHHSTDAAGIGVIEHALFVGTVDDLGNRVPLTEDASTAGIGVDQDSSIDTGTPGLAIVCVPNLRPQRRWRRNPVGAHLGRSDLDGIEPQLDALDEAWTSWMRDLRLARARIIVPEYALDTGAPGQGAGFDMDREVFTAIQEAGAAGLDRGFEKVQFDIRVEEHARTVSTLVGDIIRGAGYSAATLGQADVTATGGMTATEVTDRNRRSLLTRDRKIKLQRPAVEAVLLKLVRTDAYLNGGPGAGVERVNVDYAEAVQPDPEVTARTVGLLYAAQAISTETSVRTVHPDWTDEQVAEEVRKITDASALPEVDDPVGEGESGFPFDDTDQEAT